MQEYSNNATVSVPVALLKEINDALNYTKMFRLRQGSAYRNSYELIAVLEKHIKAGTMEEKPKPDRLG